MFKPGDRIKCINPETQKDITKDKEYIVCIPQYATSDLVTITNDASREVSYFSERFTAVESPPVAVESPVKVEWTPSKDELVEVSDAGVHWRIRYYARSTNNGKHEAYPKGADSTGTHKPIPWVRVRKLSVEGEKAFSDMPKEKWADLFLSDPYVEYVKPTPVELDAPAWTPVKDELVEVTDNPDFSWRLRYFAGNNNGRPETYVFGQTSSETTSIADWGHVRKLSQAGLNAFNASESRLRCVSIKASLPYIPSDISIVHMTSTVADTPSDPVSEASQTPSKIMLSDGYWLTAGGYVIKIKGRKGYNPINGADVPGTSSRCTSKCWMWKLDGDIFGLDGDWDEKLRLVEKLDISELPKLPEGYKWKDNLPQYRQRMKGEQGFGGLHVTSQWYSDELSACKWWIVEPVPSEPEPAKVVSTNPEEAEPKKFKSAHYILKNGLVILLDPVTMVGKVVNASHTLSFKPNGESADKDFSIASRFYENIPNIPEGYESERGLEYRVPLKGEYYLLNGQAFLNDGDKVCDYFIIHKTEETKMKFEDGYYVTRNGSIILLEAASMTGRFLFKDGNGRRFSWELDGRYRLNCNLDILHRLDIDFPEKSYNHKQYVRRVPVKGDLYFSGSLQLCLKSGEIDKECLVLLPDAAPTSVAGQTLIKKEEEMNAYDKQLKDDLAKVQAQLDMLTKTQPANHRAESNKPSIVGKVMSGAKKLFNYSISSPFSDIVSWTRKPVYHIVQKAIFAAIVSTVCYFAYTEGLPMLSGVKSLIPTITWEQAEQVATEGEAEVSEKE